MPLSASEGCFPVTTLVW